MVPSLHGGQERWSNVCNGVYVLYPTSEQCDDDLTYRANIGNKMKNHQIIIVLWDSGTLYRVLLLFCCCCSAARCTCRASARNRSNATAYAIGMKCLKNSRARCCSASLPFSLARCEGLLLLWRFHLFVINRKKRPLVLFCLLFCSIIKFHLKAQQHSSININISSGSYIEPRVFTDPLSFWAWGPPCARNDRSIAAVEMQRRVRINMLLQPGIRVAVL